jgi:hypothetical protein
MKNSIQEFLIVVILAGLTIIWSGYVLSDLWSWFLAPAGFKEISASQGAGVYLVGQVVKGAPNLSEQTGWRNILVGFGISTLALLCGWLVKTAF